MGTHREKGCSTCEGKRSNRHVAYGERKNAVWCSTCDRDHSNLINKAWARRQGKKEITFQLLDM